MAPICQALSAQLALPEGCVDLADGGNKRWKGWECYEKWQENGGKMRLEKALESEKCWKMVRKWMNMLEKVGKMLNIGANMKKTT